MSDNTPYDFSNSHKDQCILFFEANVASSCIKESNNMFYKDYFFLLRSE